MCSFWVLRLASFFRASLQVGVLRSTTAGLEFRFYCDSGLQVVGMLKVALVYNCTNHMVWESYLSRCFIVGLVKLT